MSEPSAGGIHVKGIGDVSGGQVAIGSEIQQSWTVGAPTGPPTEAELADFRRVLDDLRARIAEAAPSPELAARATEHVSELEAVGDPAQEPDLSTLEYVTKWFGKHLPAVAGAVASVVIHPVVGKLVSAAGDTAVAEFKRRFGR